MRSCDIGITKEEKLFAEREIEQHLRETKVFNVIIFSGIVVLMANIGYQIYNSYMAQNWLIMILCVAGLVLLLLMEFVLVVSLFEKARWTDYSIKYLEGKYSWKLNHEKRRVDLLDEQELRIASHWHPTLDASINQHIKVRVCQPFYQEGEETILGSYYMLELPDGPSAKFETLNALIAPRFHPMMRFMTVVSALIALTFVIRALKVMIDGDVLGYWTGVWVITTCMVFLAVVWSCMQFYWRKRDFMNHAAQCYSNASRRFKTTSHWIQVPPSRTV